MPSQQELQDAFQMAAPPISERGNLPEHAVEAPPPGDGSGAPVAMNVQEASAKGIVDGDALLQK
jgi:hypothetical protein